MERAGVLLLPACGVETSKARSEKVGMRGCLHKFGGSEYAESPPHPKFAFANFDLSPQAGRGESAARRSAKAPTLRARHGLLVRGQRGIGLGAVGAAGLRHVGAPAAALATEGFGGDFHQVDRVVARGEIGGDPDPTP